MDAGTHLAGTVDDRIDTAPGAVDEAQKETLPEAISSIAAVLVGGLFIMTFVGAELRHPPPAPWKKPSSWATTSSLIGSPSPHPPPGPHSFTIAISTRGDVIVFLKPNPESPDMVLVKRAIGVPGDRIHLRHGIVYLNGVAQNEPQAAKSRPTRIPKTPISPPETTSRRLGAPSGSTEVWSEELASHIQGEDIVVPPGKVFAMGDNRTHSLDAVSGASSPAKTYSDAPSSTTGPSKPLRTTWKASKASPTRQRLRLHRPPLLRQDSLEPHLPPHQVR